MKKNCEVIDRGIVAGYHACFVRYGKCGRYGRGIKTKRGLVAYSTKAEFTCRSKVYKLLSSRECR